MTGMQRHQSAYSWRGKIGIIVPPTNTVNEAEWKIMAPTGVTIHASRMKLHLDSHSEAGKKQIYSDIDTAVADLAAAQVDCIAYGCTAGSMVLPVNALPGYMAARCSIPCVTTAASIVQALEHLNISRICIASPYHDALNEHEAQFFKSAGFETMHAAGLGLGANGPVDFPLIARTPVERIFEHALAADRPDAQALLIACTDFPALNIINRLEEKLGKPVITSNQATFWAALRAAQIPDRFENYGILLRDH